jgi:death-on-curing protein
VKQPVWIEERDVPALHGRLLALDGGAAGVRDACFLESALARPRQLYAYGDKPDIVEMAATYVAGILGAEVAPREEVVRNHPFFDGNKRTGFVVGVLFLELNGYRFTASEEDATQAVFGLAAGTLDEAGFAAWMRANCKGN